MRRCLVYRGKISETPAGQSRRDAASLTRIRNRPPEVTGRLVFVAGHFIEALEGPPDAVGAIHDSMAANTRYTNTIILLDHPTPGPFFRDWSMDVLSPGGEADSDRARYVDTLRRIDTEGASLPTEGWCLLDLLAGVGSDLVSAGLRVPPSQPRAHVTIDRLVGATRDLLMRDGVKGVTVEAAAKASLVSFQAAYRYFATSPDLLRALVRRVQARQFLRFRVHLSQAWFSDETELAGIVAGLLAWGYLAGDQVPLSMQQILLRDYHEFAFEGLWSLATYIVQIMERRGLDTSDPMLDSKVASALAGVSAAAKIIALRDASLLATAAIQARLAGVFLGALQGHRETEARLTEAPMVRPYGHLAANRFSAAGYGLGVPS